MYSTSGKAWKRSYSSKASSSAMFGRYRSRSSVSADTPMSLKIAGDFTTLTRVFFNKPFNAPTPPRSPADIPSTSSIIRQVRGSIRTSPITVVLCLGQLFSLGDRGTHFDSSTLEETIQGGVIDISAVLSRSELPRAGTSEITHFHELLTPRVARIQLNRIIACLLCHQVRRCCLANSRRPRDQDGAIDAHAVLARLLEATLIIFIPILPSASYGDPKTSSPILQPLTQSLHWSLVPANLFDILRCILCCPQLSRDWSRFPNGLSCQLPLCTDEPIYTSQQYPSPLELPLSASSLSPLPFP